MASTNDKKKEPLRSLVNSDACLALPPSLPPSPSLQVIRSLRQELEYAQKEVKEQWTVVERAELSIEQLATLAEREEARANKAEAQAVAAQTENLKLAAQLKQVMEVDLKEMERASTDKVTLLNVQIQDLTGRLAEANSVADNASKRVEFLQTQVGGWLGWREGRIVRRLITTRGWLGG